MKTWSCLLCRRCVPSAKELLEHYVFNYEKEQLAEALLKASGDRGNFECFFKNEPRSEEKICKVEVEYRAAVKTESFWEENGENTWAVLLENVEDHRVEMEDAGQDFVEDVKTEPPSSPQNSSLSSSASSTSASSSEITDDDNYYRGEALRRRLEFLRRKKRLQELRAFRIDHLRRRKRARFLALDERSGDFYLCRCDPKNRSENTVLRAYRKNDLKYLASDTESCSEDVDHRKSPSTFRKNAKMFCDSCGNGYETKSKLLEHFETHELRCDVCQVNFSAAEEYKDHLRKHLLKVFVCHLCKKEFALKIMLIDHLDAHIEDEVYENVFGLEQDYKMKRFCY